MAEITQEEARRAILKLWPAWAEEHIPDFKAGVPVESFLAPEFFRYIESKESHLLRFRSSAAKWQMVKSWLEQARFIKSGI